MAAAVAVAAGLSACSHVHPSLGEYAITTGHGQFSSQQVQAVAGPGSNVNLGNGTTSWYFPANVRNYVTGVNGDRLIPTAELTAAGGQGNPGMSDYVYTYVGFEINPAIQVKARNGQYVFASHFLQFCLKYACATQQPQNTTANAAKERSSDPGWLNMIDEIFPRAIDNATRTAIQGFSPNLWTDQGEWPKLSDAIARALPGEIQALDGSAAEGQPDYFCGPGSTTRICTPFFIQVSKVVPSDAGIIAAYTQQQTANYELQAAATRVALAKKLYGPDWAWFIGMRDLITQCQTAGTKCSFTVGNAPFHP